MIAVRDFTLAANFVGSYAFTSTPASSYNVSIKILKNGASIGTITFNIGSYTGTFSGSPSGVAFIASDQVVLQVDNTTNPQDSTFGDFAFTIKGTSTS